MNTALRERYEELQKLLAEATGKDVRARYRIGRLIADVKVSEQRYGARAVKNLAMALGRDEATLYRFALVAEAWNDRELEVLLARKTPHGEPLSFSHLVELAQVSNKTARDEMLEFALNYGVSVRELIEAIADTGAQRSERADGSPSIDSLLRRVATTCDAVQRKIEISERLLSQLERTDPKANNSLEELLVRAVSSQRAILEGCARSIEKLERARKRFSGDSYLSAGLERDDIAAPTGAARSPSAPSAAHALPTSSAKIDDLRATGEVWTNARNNRRSTGAFRTPRLLAGLAR